MDVEFNGDFVGHAQNLWRRFPQVFAILGAPDLESNSKVDMEALESEHRRIIEALLPWTDAGVRDPSVFDEIKRRQASCAEVCDDKTIGADRGWAWTGGQFWRSSPQASEAPAQPRATEAGEISRLALRRGFAITRVETRHLEAAKSEQEEEEEDCRIDREPSEESMGAVIERIAVRNPLSDLAPPKESWPAQSERMCQPYEQTQPQSSWW